MNTHKTLGFSRNLSTPKPTAKWKIVIYLFSTGKLMYPAFGASLESQKAWAVERERKATEKEMKHTL